MCLRLVGDGKVIQNLRKDNREVRFFFFIYPQYEKVQDCGNVLKYSNKGKYEVNLGDPNT